MTQVHVELRNNLAQIGIFTLLRFINWGPSPRVLRGQHVLW